MTNYFPPVDIRQSVGLAIVKKRGVQTVGRTEKFKFPTIERGRNRKISPTRREGALTVMPIFVVYGIRFRTVVGVDGVRSV